MSVEIEQGHGSSLDEVRDLKSRTDERWQIHDKLPEVAGAPNPTEFGMGLPARLPGSAEGYRTSGAVLHLTYLPMSALAREAATA
jgi:hypothetical protein